MSDLLKYKPMIDAIIVASNPDEVSPKKIRKAIQELFAIDLDGKRKEINELIVDRFYELQSNPKVLISKDELRKKDETIAKNLQKGANGTTTVSKKRTIKKSSKGKDETKKKKRRQTEANPNSINVRKVLLSPKLQEFLGETELPRTQVVKKVWDYIKEHDLQNPDDRREILCDEKMQPIFGKKMTMFSLNKILANHLFNKDEVVGNGEAKVKKVKEESQKAVEDKVDDDEIHEEDDDIQNEGNDEEEDEQGAAEEEESEED
ncbi:hypothetical protein Kpol_1028p105 [Vanderwaltozyma polyspora DSM 70294]|uniref:Uncharacterized protein n=1 Tax=Vanderwaltozyma polyspora (strain ATCC 22028 / DSM 70294 / BCRC 21397 / CBS 2163 / NBRC 10782 / NRRL Y-8283 / UCD 57-17) TaxID=436907 RepID=A7TG72_VANPO|nr:uncharacterized protein Kpol_1028p105 [Vanderwaltozyma polyspora DSM 70294]EDO18829.1 hypothetical protein Kpol_1028p105 [Vanderwaltozyma polyspora DSM 70294]